MSDKNVRSASIRKEGREPGWTPTERRRREQLMRQFVKGDGQKGASREYLENYEQIDWSKG